MVPALAIPSAADIDMIHEVAEKLGVVLRDHIVISKHGHASLKEMGLL